MKFKYKTLFITLLAFSTITFLAFLTTTYNTASKTSSPPPDLASVDYLINAPALCNATTLLGVVVISSYAGNHVARDAIRDAYPAAELATLGLRRVFLLAQVDVGHHQEGYSNLVTEEEVVVEAKRHGDVVQLGMIEDYRNLTFKNLMGLRWVVEHCAHARFLIKTDDDVLMDLYQLVYLIASFNSTLDDKIMGAVDSDHVVVNRNKSDPDYVGYADYPLAKYPIYTLGILYMFSPQVAGRLLEASRSTSYIWKEDVHITGILASVAGVGHVNIGRHYSRQEKNIMCCTSDDLNETYNCEKFVGLVSGHGQGGDYSLMGRVKEHARRCYDSKKCGRLPMHVGVRCVK